VIFQGATFLEIRVPIFLFITFNLAVTESFIMTEKPEDEESEILKGMFEEIMKIIRQKQIRMESIVQRATEQDMISQDSFNRIYNMLSEYGKKKQWM
jgi:hypothetical protein